ncbi:MAG TPA: Ig-like domain-containing protein, partial [Clostridia bacterium]|nr:Ig-like domain-containing protein [Clostridia bacterium]
MHIKEFIKKHRIKLSVISVSLLILVAAAVIFIQFSSETAPAVADISGINYHNINVIPLSCDKTGVDIKSGFKITSKQDISEAALKAVLKVSPSQEYKLKKLSSTEYRLNFKDDLKPDSIYKVSMGNKADSKRSWAFQTKKVFRIERTLPRNISTDVPLNSGIEITFSDENLEKVDKYFEISPKAEGKFEYHKKTVVFVPEKLAENTVYTVTVKKGLGLAGSDDKIQEDYTFKFQTVLNQSDNSNATKYFNIEGDSINNFTTDTLPELQLYGDGYFKNKEFNVEIFKYPSDKEFMSDLKKYDTLPYWAHTDTDSRRFESGSLTAISSFKTTLFDMNNEYWNTYILRFPSKLSEGHYLVNVTCEDKVKQALMQVSDNVCYFMAGEKNSLAWINDSVTGKPVKGVSIEAEGLGTAETGKDGVAVIKGKIPDPQKGANYYFKASRENKPAFIAPLSYYQYTDDNDKPECKYWSYMYLDRGLYLPTDTVNLWGIVKPRNGSDAPSKATLELYPSAYNGSSDNDRLSMISSKEIKLSSLGTYNSRMDISNLSQGSYYIQLKLGDSIVSSNYFEVRQYTKPAYKLTAVPDKNPMFSWESTKLAVQASFFEGSPVTGLNLNYYYKASSNNEGKLKCDQNGSAQLTLHPDRSANTFRPYYMDYSISNAQAEEETISVDGEIVVFPSDLMIETKTTKKGAKGLVDVQTHNVSFDKKILEDDLWYSSDAYRGSTVDKQLHASIYEEYWTAKENGKYYDFIDKTVHKLYQYTKVEKIIKELDFKTEGGKHSFDFNIDADKNKNYKIVIKGTDSHNNTIVEETYLDGYSGYDPNSYTSGFKYYTVENTSDKIKFKTGDTVPLDIYCNGQAVPESSNARSLYLRLSNGLLDYTVTDNTKYSFDFDSSYIPNMYVQGVYFDG